MQVRICAVLAACAVFQLASSSVTAAARSRHGSAFFSHIESSPAVFNVLYRYGQNTPSADGAYGPNVTAPRTSWYLEYQRAGALDVIDGVVRSDEDPSLVRLGLSMFHFGLSRESADGLFPGSVWPFHGTAMFLSEATPALIVLQHSALAGQFRFEVDWEIDRMRRAAYAMVGTVGGPGNLDDYTKNHRWFEAAIALGAVGLLAHDRTLQGWSAVYAWHGVHMARPDGIMPEDGGHDTGYQALGMVNATRYLELLATGNLRSALRGVLSRGEDWLLSRIRPNGSINQQGDTRSVGCQERDPLGHCKTAMYDPVYSSLAHWAAYTGESRFATAARHVWYRAGYWSRK